MGDLVMYIVMCSHGHGATATWPLES